MTVDATESREQEIRLREAEARAVELDIKRREMEAEASARWILKQQAETTGVSAEDLDDIAALLDTVLRVVREAVAAVVTIAARVVIGLNGIVVGQSLEVIGDQALQFLPRRTLFCRHNRFENRIVR